MKITIAFGCLLTAASLAAQDSRQAARQEETRACIQCHGLRLIHSQRLSAAAWGKEIDKMIGWGAELKNRQLLASRNRSARTLACRVGGALRARVDAWRVMKRCTKACRHVVVTSARR